MKEVIYSDADLLAVIKQRHRILNVFFAVTFAFAAFCIGWLIYYWGLPYKDPMQALPKAMIFVATGIYIIFLFPFMGIKYSRINRYYRLLCTISEGKKNEETCYFAFFAEKDLQKERVDVVSCVFKTWNNKKQEWREREVYFDVQKEWPDLEQGDYVRYVVQSNFLIAYDVLQRQALTAEELGESDEDYDDEDGGQAENGGQAEDGAAGELENEELGNEELENEEK